jgi:ATP-dependent DNA ligase
MACLPVSKLPQGHEWSYEIKLDGFRLEAVKTKGETTLFSRRGNILNRKFHYIATALKKLPDNTVLDDELVALDSKDKSDFGLLQNFRSAESKIHFYVFDILTPKGKDVSQRPLDERRALFDKILPRNEHISVSAVEHGSYSKLLKFVKQHGLEGIIAKRSDSSYEPGKRSGLWQKYRLNLQQEFVIGGYTRAAEGFDALIIGFYRGKDLVFVARVRAGFVPASRREVYTAQGPQNHQMPVRRPAPKRTWPVGPRPDRRENETMCMVKTGNGCANWFRRVDKWWSPAPPQIRRATAWLRPQESCEGNLIPTKDRYSSSDALISILEQ